MDEDKDKVEAAGILKKRRKWLAEAKLIEEPPSAMMEKELKPARDLADNTKRAGLPEETKPAEPTPAEEPKVTEETRLKRSLSINERRYIFSYSVII